MNRNDEVAEPAATAQRGQPSVFGQFIRIRSAILARPAWLIFYRWAKAKLLHFIVFHPATVAWRVQQQLEPRKKMNIPEISDGTDNWIILLPESDVGAAVAALSKAGIRYVAGGDSGTINGVRTSLIEIGKKYSKEEIIKALSQK